MEIYSITSEQGESYTKSEINDMLKEIGISDDAISQGTDDAIEQAAQKLGITDITKQLTEKIKGSSGTAKEDYSTQLEAQGVPTDIIKQGQAAVEKYAEENNINLPKSKGTNLNLSW